MKLGGRYRLIEKLGSGGMAIVWLAEDEVLDRQVAVKVPSDALAADAAFLRRFQREAQIAARLSHPNLVAVYDYSRERGERPFLVMQYVDGDTLAALAEGGTPVDAERLARELLSALDHIHAAGIVHRDVKPSNVMVTGDGRAQLTDFGIAQAEDATRITQTGQMIGTRGYMAPEVMAGKRATARSDLYSAGMVLRDHVGPDERAALRELVARLTADEPRARPASAADALASLEAAAAQPATQIAAGEPTTQIESPTAPTRPIPVERRGITVTRRQLLAGLIVVALILGFVALNSGGDGETPQPTQTQAAEAPTETTPTETAPADEGEAPAGGGNPAEGARLNQQGYALVQQGRPDQAVPILEQAVASFPEGTSDLNYAYALFNLGQALRLSGRPEEAIPILEERATIDNQRDTVLAELAKAREAAGD